MFRLKLQLRGVILVCICILTLLACGTGEIQNFEGITIISESRVDRINITIYLTDKHGIPLIWNQSILSPSVGVSTISDADFITNAKIYSIRNGEKNRLVYDNRLVDVRWGQEPNSLDRLLKAEIPRALIDEDPDRDTTMGVITVEVKTEKQGPFTDTIEKTAIYRK